MLLMMTVNRVNHTTLAIQQARTIDKLLLAIHSATSAGLLDKAESLRKELKTSSSVLAATLVTPLTFPLVFPLYHNFPISMMHIIGREEILREESARWIL